MKKIFSGILAISLVSIMIVACKKYNNNYSNGSNGSPMIYMKNSVFSNPNVQITSGTTVVWTNDDNAIHTVTADNGSFNSGDIQPGSTFSWTFKSTGTFTYHDKHVATMTGVVTVVNATMPTPY